MSSVNLKAAFSEIFSDPYREIGKSTATKLSIVPGIQQVIGTCTIISNVAKTIYNLVCLIFNLIKTKGIFITKNDEFISFSNSEMMQEEAETLRSSSGEQEKLKKFLKSDLGDNLQNASLKAFVIKEREHLNKKAEDLSMRPDVYLKEKLASILKANNSFTDASENLGKHLSFIAVGILRALPVVGTIYSYTLYNRSPKMLTIEAN